MTQAEIFAIDKADAEKELLEARESILDALFVARKQIEEATTPEALAALFTHPYNHWQPDCSVSIDQAKKASELYSGSIAGLAEEAEPQENPWIFCFDERLIDSAADEALWNEDGGDF